MKQNYTIQGNSGPLYIVSMPPRIYEYHAARLIIRMHHNRPQLRRSTHHQCSNGANHCGDCGAKHELEHGAEDGPSEEFVSRGPLESNSPGVGLGSPRWPKFATDAFEPGMCSGFYEYIHGIIGMTAAQPKGPQTGGQGEKR